VGGMRLSAGDIYERDLFVVKELRQRGIPVVMLPSGGYSRNSWQLTVTSILSLLGT